MIEEQVTVAELVKQDFRTAKVFQKYGIDFCCGGGKSVHAACLDREVDEQLLNSELKSILKSTGPIGLEPDNWPLDLLIDYIEKKHHRFIRETLPALTQFLVKVERVHGDKAPYLTPVLEMFQSSATHLLSHMEKEEKMLFPYIRAMVGGATLNDSPFGTIRNPISIMKYEHANEGEQFFKMSEMTDDFSPPSWACNTFVVAMEMLKEFRDDLFFHIHLENNILFPKAEKLEMSLIPTEQNDSE